MLPFLQKLHAIAAERGDGLRPEFLSAQLTESFSMLLCAKHAEPGASLGDGGDVPARSTHEIADPPAHKPAAANDDRLLR